MKRIIKFMLLAAFVLPAWLSTAAQNTVPPKNVTKARLESESRFKNRPQLNLSDVPTEVAQQAVESPEVAPVQAAPQAATGIRKHFCNTGNASMPKAPMRAGTVVTPPPSATIEVWDISTTWTYYTGSAWSPGEYNTTSVQVAFDDNENAVYISGLCYWIPSAWVKGTFNSAKTQVTFATGQYYGIDNYDEEDWFVGSNSTSSASGVDVVFTYNSATNTLTLASGTYIFTGTDASGSQISDYHSGTVLHKPTPGTIAEGTGTSQHFPIYGWYYDTSTSHNQMIYPASMLGDLEGRKIKSITFYSSTGLKFSEGEAKLTIGATSKENFNNATSYSSSIWASFSGDNTSATLVAESGAETITFTFEEPFDYVSGTNLLFDVTLNEIGNCDPSSSNSTMFYGKTTGSTYYSYYYGSNNSYGREAFLPMFTYEFAEDVETEELNFGSVAVNSTKTLGAVINNPSDETVTATLATAAPFAVENASVSLEPGMSTVRVSFKPTAAISYNGNLTVTINGTEKNIRLKGVGTMSGPEALRDSTFFAGITYEWTDSLGKPRISRLDEIATEPSQIIAMMTKIYTDPEIPGNLKRGFSATGADEPGNVVNYPGVGTISHTGSSFSSGYSFEPTYGWNIPGRLETPVTNKSFRYYGNSSYYSTYYADYCYMDSMQYVPKYDGVTLLLIETVDDFNHSNVEAAVAALPSSATDSLKLLTQIAYTVKSARIVTQAKRTGTGLEKGTLFKIDADKLNKFFFLAKGQVRRVMNSWLAIGEQTQYTAFRANPSYFRLKNSTTTSSTLREGFVDGDTGDPFYHMFEQFSPTAVDAGAGLDDIYQALVRMESFGVKHDCMGIPNMNHHFMMYGEDSDPDDCQDVRDMMFFVPDYRMLKFSSDTYTDDDHNRDRASLLRYLNYNRSHMPTLGLFVIHQDSIPAGTIIRKDETTMTGLYQHQLSWNSNLDDFLPGDEQEYELWQVVIDEFGNESYQPVYYRNNQGQYTDKNGNVVSTPVAIVLDRQNLSSFTYPTVYVDMKAGSQAITYVIRGRDKGHFLSLQMSNQQTAIIPGIDPNEKVRLFGTTYYSRYNPDNEKNCYSNKLKMSNNAEGLTQSDLNNSLNIYRISRPAQVDANGNVVVDANGNIQYATEANKELVATSSVSGTTITLHLDKQSPASEYPVGKRYGDKAGYHENGSLSFPFTVKNGYVNFGDFYFWDNFTVDVSKNAHPLQYLYKVEIGNAYSNEERVPVYKTDSQINGSYTKEEVDNDDTYGLAVDIDPEFKAKIQYSGKSEILRYDAYRWNEKVSDNDHYYIIDSVIVVPNFDPEDVDIAPTGMAGNQGEWYTVSMNKVQEPEYYYAATADEQPHVSDSNPLNWATFVDYYPRKQEANMAQAYTYAPVVELFSKGYKEKKENNKLVERTDYNTYGGPLQHTAFGELDVEVVTPSAQVPLMSNMSWIDSTDVNNKKKYAWYQIFLDVKKANVPANYSLYGIRAWRWVDPELLGEHPRYPRPDRLPQEGSDFEDIMFEKILGGNGYDTTYEFLGSATADYTDVQNGEVRGTFGARKLRTTEPASDKSVIDELDAEFVVRAYFTYKPIFVYANQGGDTIDCQKAVGTLYSNDGKTYSGTITIPAGRDGNGYFVFSKKIGSDWQGADNQYIFGAKWDDGVALVGSQGPNNDWDFNLKYWSGNTKCFKITPGTYQFTINNHVQALAGPGYDAGSLHIRQSTAKAEADNATGKFFVAEKTLNFSTKDLTEIPTGIIEINNGKQVVSVKYYNVAGIESDRPFDGVNIVVTRFNDGSTATQKMMK